ncbi:MAG: winged helix-turn-helix domain-containing protein [Methanoregula sp.]|jgi:predicted transcriptional regulator|nr:winged helix-turn-helix domain-containing protein [Methanoregula sp.]
MSDLIAIVTTSEKRKRLLLLLLSGPKSLDEIKTQLNVTASGMLPQIRILEEEGLIIKEDGTYGLTDIGQLTTHQLEQFERTLSVIEHQKKFWQEHDIGAIPPAFLHRLGELKKTHIVEAETEDSFEPHSQFLDMILKSENVAGISPIVHPIYPHFFLSLAKQGRDVSLILSKNAYEKIRKEYYDFLLEGVQYNNAHLSIYEDNPKFAYIVTEKYFCMSMFTKTGIFDSKRDLVSTEPSAIKWGKDLFSYYQKQARPVNKDGQYGLQ